MCYKLSFTWLSPSMSLAFERYCQLHNVLFVVFSLIILNRISHFLFISQIISFFNLNVRVYKIEIFDFLIQINPFSNLNLLN